MDIERLINRHKDSVYRQMVRVCGNHDDAEDALSQAIFSAIKASDQLRDPSIFRAWLARIGSRACIRMRIRNQLIGFTSLADLESKGFDVKDTAYDTAKEAEMATLKSCVTGAVELLPPDLREVYLRREIAGDTAEVVAHDLNLSVAATKSRLYRARQQVRHALDNGLGCADLVS